MQKKDLVADLVNNIETRGDVPDNVVKHVERNLLLATNTSSICVDGGYTKEQASGELARPGADLGISLSLMGMGLTPEQAFSVVYDYRIAHDQKYGWHTDTHEGHDGSVVGCGHCKAAINHNSHYEGASEADVGRLLGIIRENQNSHPENMRFVILDREHAEQGIFIINDQDITLYPWDQDDGHNDQFFVYDSARDQALLQAIVEFINEQHLTDAHGQVVVVDYDQLKANVDQHTQATLGLLGSSKGKPIYDVLVEDGKLVIAEAGNAPEIDTD